MSITDQEFSLKVSFLASKELFMSGNVCAMLRRKFVPCYVTYRWAECPVCPYLPQIIPHTDQEQPSGFTLGLSVFAWRWFLLVRVVLFRFSVSLKWLLPGEELLLLLIHLCTVTKHQNLAYHYLPGCIDFSVISQISSFSSLHIQWRSYWHTISSVIQFHGVQQAALVALFVMFSVPKKPCCWITSVFCVSVCSC